MPDIHPLVVHFPIALCTMYALFEVARIPWLVRKQWYFYVKAVMVTFGSLGAVASTVTGMMAADGFGESPAVETHEHWAQFTTLFFLIVGGTYAMALIAREFPALAQKDTLFARKLRACTSVVESRWSALLGAIGMLLITIVGALGGALVYGPDFDPAAKLFTELLVPKE